VSLDCQCLIGPTDNYQKLLFGCFHHAPIAALVNCLHGGCRRPSSRSASTVFFITGGCFDHATPTRPCYPVRPHGIRLSPSRPSSPAPIAGGPPPAQASSPLQAALQHASDMAEFINEDKIRRMMTSMPNMSFSTRMDMEGLF
jgi:hypothetical protein